MSKSRGSAVCVAIALSLGIVLLFVWQPGDEPSDVAASSITEAGSSAHSSPHEVLDSDGAVDGERKGLLGSPAATKADDTPFPPIEDLASLRERLSKADADEWDRLGIDMFFSFIFSKLKTQGTELDVELSDRRVNPENRSLSPSQQAQLSLYLAEIGRQIHDVRCFYEIARYQGFVDSRTTNRTLYSGISSESFENAEERRAEHYRQKDFIERLAQSVGGMDSLEYMWGTAYPGDGRPESIEQWVAMKQAGSLPNAGMRLYHFSRADAPMVFDAKERLGALRTSRWEMARAFIDSLPR